MTLLTRLFLLVLLAVVPALGMQLHSVLQLRSERAGEIVAQAERILHMVEGEQSHIVESARLMLAAVAEASFLRTNDVPRCQTYLNRLVRSSEGYRAISVADRDGRILCSGDPSRIGATMADLPHFRRALMEERFVVGEWQPGSSAAGSSAARSSAAGSPDDGGELPVAVPFRGEDGTLGGVVTAALDAPWLTRNFAARPLPGNASLIVADRSGTVLVKLPAGTAGIGEKLPASHLALLGAERMGVAALPGLDGVPRVMAFSPATAGVRDLFIGVGIDQAAAMGAIDRATRDGVLMTLAGLVVAIAAAWIGGTWFIRRPVEALVHAAQCWRTGDSAARANLADRSSEIGRLGQAFDAMAETLETREAALRASERHTRAVLDALPVLIGVLTTDGVVVQVNHAAAQALGLPAKRIVGNPFGQVCCLSQGEDGGGRLREALAEAAAGRQTRFDAALRMNGGRTVMVDIGLTPMRDETGRVTHVIASGLDITERKQAEEALRVAGERFRTALRNSGVTVFNQDLSLRYTWAHKPILSFGPEDLIGRTDHEVLESREDADRLTAIKRRVLETGEGCRQEVSIREKGTTWFFDLTVDPLHDDDGRLTGITCAAVNVTDRKQAEADLKRAREEADRANIAKSKFLAAASHDLRQPVQSLYLFAAALGDRLQGHPGQGLLDNMRQGLDTLKGLLDGLLDISRLESGKITAAPVDIRLNLLLGRLVAEYAPRAQQKGLELRAIPTRAWVRSDPAHLERILRNLLENALRYTPRGRILIGCRRRGDAVRVEVWDSGLGIPADRLCDIFEEFTQLGDRNGRGLGLGLAIVRRLSRLLDHPIGVHSQEGKGSVFSVTLPRVTAASPAAATTSTRPAAAMLAASAFAEPPCRPVPGAITPPGPGSPAVARGIAPRAAVNGAAVTGAVANDGAAKDLVLVIDDEAIILLGLKAMLEGWGYDVLTARSGDQALERLRADGRRPRLVLADYQLQQGRTGPEALVAVQGLVGTDVPGIILTGDTAPERLAEAERNGFRILHKPVFPNELRRMMALAGAA